MLGNVNYDKIGHQNINIDSNITQTVKIPITDRNYPIFRRTANIRI